MITPLMIWSARIVMHSQAWSSESAMATSDGDDDAEQERRGDAERLELEGGQVRLAEAGRHEAGEGARQHHALDADVHHARSLVHDAAQGTEGDRRRQRPG